MSTARVPYAAAARSLLRTTVINAVDELVRARGWKATTMADVAEAAGVSRQTLYNEFGSRQALVEAYVIREIETLLGEVGVAVRENADDAHAALESAFALFLKLASDEPVVQIIVANTGGTGELTRLLTSVAQPVAVSQVGELIIEVWAQVSLADAQLVADTLVRLAVSHALFATGSPIETAREVGRMIAPFIDKALGLS